MSERLDGTVRFLLLGILTLAPVFYVPLDWMLAVQAKVLVTSLVLVLVAVLWGFARFAERSLTLPRAGMTLAVLFLPLVYLASAIVDGFRSVSLVGSGVESDTVAFVALGALTLLITTSVFAHHPARIERAVRALLLGCALFVSAQLVHIVLPLIAFGGRFAGQGGSVFGSLHEGALYAGFSLIFALAAARAFPPGSWRFLARATAGAAAVALVFANFVDVWVITLLGLVLSIASDAFRNRAWRSIAFWKKERGVGGVIALAVLCILISPLTARFIPIARLAEAETRPSIIGTALIAQSALTTPEVIALGTGPNTFSREWGLYKPAAINLTPHWDADFSVGFATIATALITVGALGALAWLLLFGTLLFSMRRMSRESAALPLAIGLGYLILVHLLAAPGATGTLMLFLVTGVFVAAARPRAATAFEDASWSGKLAPMLVLVFAGALLISAAALARTTLAEALVNKAVTVYNERAYLAGAVHYTSLALALSGESDRAHRASVELGLLSLRQMIATADPEDSAARLRLESMLQETIKHGLAAIAIDDESYRNWLVLASLYAQLAGSEIAGAYEKAREALDKAIAENPASPVPHLASAQLEAGRGNTVAATRDLVRVIELKPDMAAAHYLLSQILASEGTYDRALGAAQRATDYAPGESDAWYNLGAIAYTAGQYQEASAALDEALVRRPAFANALYVQGLVRYRLDDRAGAIAAFEALDTLDPGHADVAALISDLKADRALTDAQLHTTR
jgi:tetratricopeptide (TPR) repeat protein